MLDLAVLSLEVDSMTLKVFSHPNCPMIIPWIDGVRCAQLQPSRLVVAAYITSIVCYYMHGYFLYQVVWSEYSKV